MRAREIAELVGGELHGDDVDIHSVADIDSADSGQIAFFEKGDVLPSTNAACVIVGSGSSSNATGPCVITVENPKLAFAKLAAKLHPRKVRRPELHSSAVISPTAKIGKNT